MKIAIIGTKGIPANYGGFETFAFQLAKQLSNSQLEITVVNEKGNQASAFEFPVKVLYSKYKKSKNPLRFYKQSLKLVCETHDIVLVCGVGGAVFYPLYKGNAIIVTNVDGLEHLRGKYTFLQRKFVFVLQKLASVFSDYLIADSFEVEKYWASRFSITEKKLTSIAYGAELPVMINNEILAEHGVLKNDYFLVVARLVPENNLKLIIDAFANYSGSKKLVVVGNVSDNPFAQLISNCSDKRILFIGSLYDKAKLDSLRINCFAYIHGHSVGGTNPALLEAMICKCACICHDNVFNREVTNNNQMYFKSSRELLICLDHLEVNDSERVKLSEWSYSRVVDNYSWDKIASQYLNVFTELMQSQGK